MIIIVVAAIAMMLIVGKHLARESRRGSDALSGAPAVGAAAPAFELSAIDGKKMRLQDFRGKAVLLNFWATWCEPCKIEMPWFVELQKEYGPQGLQVIGVAMDDSGKSQIEKFAQQIGVNYPVLLGTESVGEAYGGVEGLPTTFYLDREGKVVARVIGLTGRDEIENNVKKGLNQGHVAQGPK